jgi:pimeloyl-ACP methyl ester carboxylesterase
LSQQAAVETGYADILDGRLYYEVTGQGHPLVFVHAGIADSRMWNQQFDVFGQHYRVVRYDMRGYGKSSPVEHDFAHRSDLELLLGHLGIERAYLVGCSMGGATLIDFTLENPDMVAALVTVGSRPNGLVRESETIPPQWDELVMSFKAGDLVRASELEVQIWVDGPQRTPDQVHSAVRDLVREMNLIALQNEKQEKGNNVTLEPAAYDRLGDIGVPVLAIAGELDDPDVVWAAQVIEEAIPGAKRAIIPGTAHVPCMETPEAFNRILLDFLRGIER